MVHDEVEMGPAVSTRWWIIKSVAVIKRRKMLTTSLLPAVSLADLVLIILGPVTNQSIRARYVTPTKRLD